MRKSMVYLIFVQSILFFTLSKGALSDQNNPDETIQTSDFYFIEYPTDYQVSDVMYKVKFMPDTTSGDATTAASCQIDQSFTPTRFPVIFSEDFTLHKCKFSVDLLTQISQKLNPVAVLFISRFNGERWQIESGLRELPNVLQDFTQTYFASAPFSSTEQIESWINSNSTVTLTHGKNVYQEYRYDIQGYLAFSSAIFFTLSLTILLRGLYLMKQRFLETWFRRYLVAIAFLAALFYGIYQALFAFYCKGYYPAEIKDSIFSFAGALVYTNYCSIVVVWLRIRAFGLESGLGWKMLIYLTWFSLFIFWISSWIQAIGYMIGNYAMAKAGMNILLYGFAPVLVIQCCISFFAVSKVRKLLMSLDEDSYKTAALRKLTAGVTGNCVAMFCWLVCVGIILAIKGYSITTTVIKIVAQDIAFFLLISTNAFSILTYVFGPKDSSVRSIKEPSSVVTIN